MCEPCAAVCLSPLPFSPTPYVFEGWFCDEMVKARARAQVTPEGPCFSGFLVTSAEQDPVFLECPKSLRRTPFHGPAPRTHAQTVVPVVIESWENPRTHGDPCKKRS